MRFVRIRTIYEISINRFGNYRNFKILITEDKLLNQLSFFLVFLGNFSY